MSYPSMDLQGFMGQWATETVTVTTEATREFDAFKGELMKLKMWPDEKEKVEREDVRDTDLVVEVPEELL